MTVNSQISYQQAAVRNASAVELVIMLYDVLMRDLQQAIAAMQDGDIEGRTTRLKHALLALEQLEGSLDMEAGGQLATSLSRLYSVTRRQIIDAQVRQAPEILTEMLALLLDVRGAWVEVSSASGPDKAAQSPYRSVESEGPSFSWRG